MKSFNKAARMALASFLALCMALSLVTVSVYATEATLSFGTSTLLLDGYYSQEITVGGLEGEATVLVYASDNSIAYVDEGAFVNGSCTFTMEVPKGTYTVYAGGSNVTAVSDTLVLNTAPAFANAPYAATILDNAAVGDVVATLSATDADNDAITYSVSGSANYAISGANVVVANGANLAVGTDSLTVTASDGVASVNTTLTVTVDPYIPTYDITAVAAISDVWVRPDDISAVLPGTVEVTYPAGVATATIAWDAYTLPTVVGSDVTVSGTLTLPEVVGATLQNGNNLTASVTIKLVDESIAMTVNGKATATYYNALDTAAEIAVTYGNAAEATYAFVVSDSETPAAPADGEYSATATYNYAGAAEEGTVYVYVFVKDGNKVLSDRVAIINTESTFASGIYLNATLANPTYSAFRINSKGTLRITGSITSLNGDNDGEYVYSIMNKDMTETIETNATGEFNDLSKLNDRTAYVAKIALVDEEVELAAATRVFYVADFSIWFTDYTIDRLPNRSGITLNKNKNVVSSITYDQADPDTNTLYASYAISNYGSSDYIYESDGELIDKLTYTKNLDLSGYDNGAYTIYQRAKMDSSQSYYDVKFGKTVYLYDRTALICNILLNGKTGCALGNTPSLTLKAKWYSSDYEALAPEGLKYTYKIYRLIDDEYEDSAFITTDTVLDNETVTIADISGLAFKNKVVLNVELPDGSIETIVKIFYPTL